MVGKLSSFLKMPATHSKNKFPSAKKGFTLIELLVVMSIISTLSTTILGSVNLARRKAYNTYTILTIRSYQTAIELYNTTQGSYPDPGDTLVHCLGLTTCAGNGGIAINAAITNNVTPYISSFPPIGPILLDFGIQVVTNYVGPVYLCALRQGVCKGYTLQWPMHDFGDRTCTLPGSSVFGRSLNNEILCTVTVQ